MKRIYKECSLPHDTVVLVGFYFFFVASPLLPLSLSPFPPPLPPNSFSLNDLVKQFIVKFQTSASDTLAGSIPIRRSLARQQMLLRTSNHFNKPDLRISVFETFKAFSLFLFLSCYSHSSWSGVKSKCDTISLASSIKIANSIVSLSWNALSVWVCVWK